MLTIVIFRISQFCLNTFFWKTFLKRQANKCMISNIDFEYNVLQWKTGTYEP